MFVSFKCFHFFVFFCGKWIDLLLGPCWCLVGCLIFRLSFLCLLFFLVCVCVLVFVCWVFSVSAVLFCACWVFLVCLLVFLVVLSCLVSFPFFFTAEFFKPCGLWVCSDVAKDLKLD